MAKASINFKAVKNNSKVHNERLSELEYVYSDLTKNNESWKSDEIENRLSLIKEKCKTLSGRKLQKNATPIREAVVNLNEHHTLEDLQKLAQDLEQTKGIKCFQIFIHRDEGVTREDLNYHAHMVFDWQDQITGKMRRLNKVDMSQIQTLVADRLQMERGELKVNSNRQRLEPVEYKRQQEELRLQDLQQQAALEQKKNTAARAEYEEARESYERFKGVSQTRSEELARKGVELDWSAVKAEANALSGAIELQQGWANRQEQQIEELAGEISATEGRIKELGRTPEARELASILEEIENLEKRARRSAELKSEIARIEANLSREK